ncbi:hypothetical protein [Catenulispora pinisilvae]|uniref:hypothetical protein n=1 Tax=Catenulispora pinisilvae TaxID=2705253 RepID=UPI0018925752|nr:hypothetical protein [Catenulispora pinisilvae]
MAAPNTSSRIRACWLSWIAVEAADPAGVVEHLGLTDVREISWTGGAGLVDEIAHDHDRFFTVVVVPAVAGWTLVFGPWASLLYLENVVHVTDLCREMSECFGKAHAYFTSEQNDGEAWLIARDGVVVRRYISEYPELALGEPFGAERRHLDAAGIMGRPEDLDPDSDEPCDWLGTYLFAAVEIAAESSLDPTNISGHAHVVGSMLLAQAPAFELKDPITGTAPHLGESRIVSAEGPAWRATASFCCGSRTGQE